MRALVLAVLLLGCSDGGRTNCGYSHCEPYPPCDETVTVPIEFGDYTRTAGGAPDVVGGIMGQVTATLDEETDTFVLRFTRQNGEEVELTYDIDEIGIAADPF